MDGNLDDHTFYLLLDADEKIRRALLLIDQQRLHIQELHPSRRQREHRELRALLQSYTRLVDYRRALLSEPSRDFMN